MSDIEAYFWSFGALSRSVGYTFIFWVINGIGKSDRTEVLRVLFYVLIASS